MNLESLLYALLAVIGIAFGVMLSSLVTADAFDSFMEFFCSHIQKIRSRLFPDKPGKFIQGSDGERNQVASTAIRYARLRSLIRKDKLAMKESKRFPESIIAEDGESIKEVF